MRHAVICVLQWAIGQLISALFVSDSRTKVRP